MHPQYIVKVILSNKKASGKSEAFLLYARFDLV